METIHIEIAGRNYPLSIPSAEKAQVNTAAKIVNAQVEKFRKQFEIEDPVDLLAMTALQLASKATTDQPLPARKDADLNENQMQRIDYLQKRIKRVLED